MSRETKVTVDTKKKELTIVMPLIEPRESKSRKSLTIASTFGNLQTDTQFQGKNITLGVNAYIKNN